jgi:hypothetical protein
MIHLYVYSFLAGLFGTNGVPHFVKGVMGQKHQVPFKNGASAAVNVAWGWFNFVLALLLLHVAHPRAHELRAFACVAIGSLIMGLLLAYTWTKHPEYNK